MHAPPNPALAILHRPHSYLERLDVQSLFPTKQPLEVELGAGDGSFLLEWAALNPGINLLGVERLMGRLKKIEKKGRRRGLLNLRGMRIEIGYFTEYLLPPASVSAFHIYFPDPWPKKRHRKNRLIQEPFTNALRAALAKNGKVYLRTDDLDYFEQMVAVFAANTAFRKIDMPAELIAVKTDFESVFNSQGIPTNYAAYEKIA